MPTRIAAVEAAQDHHQVEGIGASSKARADLLTGLTLFLSSAFSAPVGILRTHSPYRLGGGVLRRLAFEESKPSSPTKAGVSVGRRLVRYCALLATRPGRKP
jgi:hypothetical protein